MTYRAAVIGLSAIASAPIQQAPASQLGSLIPQSHIAAYAAAPVTTVVAVCDLMPAMREAFERSWGGVFPQARSYSDYRQMLAQERVDILSVATPDHLHSQIVLDAVEAGVRGILCEKPIATTLAEADAMIDMCRKRGVALLIDHTRRWHPEYIEARSLIRGASLGPLRTIYATLGGPRAMLFRNGTHLVDSVCFFAESQPIWMTAELDSEHASYGPRYAGDGGRAPASDPGGSAYIHFANGTRAFINASKRTLQNYELDLTCERGRIRIGTHVSEVWRNDERGGISVQRLRSPQVTQSGIFAAIQELIELIERGGIGSSSGEDARTALAILLAILQSSASGSIPVRFPIRDA
jgi:predicted dehydrogenase